MNAGSLLVLTILVSPDGAAAAEAPTLMRLAAVQDDDAQADGAQANGAVSPADASGEGAEDGEGKTAEGQTDGENAENEEEECKVAIMNLQSKGLPPDQKHVATLLTDTMAAEIQAQNSCKVVTQSDIMQMLDFEASKAAVCTDESDSCLAEIGGALGVDRVIGGSVGMLGSSFKLQVKLQNVREGRVEARVDELIKGEPELLDAAARNAARTFFGGEPIVVAASQNGEAKAGASGEGASSEGGGATAEGGDSGGSAFGTILLSAGVVGLGLGVVAMIVAGAAAGGIEVVLSVPLEATRSLNDIKPVLPIAGIGALVVVGAGAVLFFGGAGLATAGLFVE